MAKRIVVEVIEEGVRVRIKGKLPSGLKGTKRKKYKARVKGLELFLIATLLHDYIGTEDEEKLAKQAKKYLRRFDAGELNA